ncbi:MAG TPA: hypothetical protein ENJ79_06065 [Gammaproteobacteria bacterium]|nr:hypothetical protein [Gammaproteobacteria bacterium]
MTKITSDILMRRAPDTTQVNAIDLARRFEWRMSWEKSQLDRASQNAAGDGVNHAGRPAAQESGNSAQPPPPQLASRPVTGETAGQTAPRDGVAPASADTVAVRASDGVRPLGLAPLAPPLDNPAAAGAVQIRPAGAGRYVVPAAPGSGPRFMLSRNRTDARPQVQVYLNGNEVEVSLRQSGYAPNEGARVLASLRRPLLALGVDLARLTVNGELVWLKRAAQGSGADRPPGASEHRIDRSY